MSRSLPVAVIPAYNAETTLAATVAEIMPFVSRVFVVDDGSGDATAEIAENLPEVVLLRQRRKGPGAAVFAGLRAAAEQGHEFAVVVDADGQMDASYIPALCQPLIDGAYDFMRGSRLQKSSGGDEMPPWRHAAARLLTPWVGLSAKQSISDPLSGFVALRLSFLPAGLWKGFGYPMHLVAALARGGARIGHVPVPARYPKEGKSHHGLHRLPSVTGAFVSALFERLR
jgi:glycosyltransferase involved in cell wall biosynthesis